MQRDISGKINYQLRLLVFLFSIDYATTAALKLKYLRAVFIHCYHIIGVACFKCVCEWLWCY